MRVRILKKCWTLLFVPGMHKNEKRLGDRDSPDTPNKKIRVDDSLSDFETLHVLIHEFLHAAFWWLDEETVAEAAKDFARELWRLKYRRNGK